MSLVEPKFKKGDRVEHVRKSDGCVRSGVIVGVHTEDLVNGLFYTMKLDAAHGGHELQASETKLRREGEDSCLTDTWKIDRELWGKYEKVFDQVQSAGFFGGPHLFSFFQKSGLADNLIQDLICMIDMDKDGYLSKHEFIAAFHIAVGVSKKGKRFPTEMPDELLRLCTKESVPAGNGTAADSEPQQEFQKSSPTMEEYPTPQLPQVPQQQSEQQTPESVTPWELSHDRMQQYNELFDKVQNEGYFFGPPATTFFQKSGLMVAEIEQLFQMADKDSDGKLNRLEFCVAFHVAVCVKKGNGFPSDGLPEELVSLYPHQETNLCPAQFNDASFGHLETAQSSADPFASLQPDESTNSSYSTFQTPIEENSNNPLENTEEEDWGGFEGVTESSSTAFPSNENLAGMVVVGEELSSTASVNKSDEVFVEVNKMEEDDWGGFESADNFSKHDEILGSDSSLDHQEVSTSSGWDELNCLTVTEQQQQQVAGDGDELDSLKNDGFDALTNVVRKSGDYTHDTNLRDQFDENEKVSAETELTSLGMTPEVSAEANTMVAQLEGESVFTRRERALENGHYEHLLSHLEVNDFEEAREEEVLTVPSIISFIHLSSQLAELSVSEEDNILLRDSFRSLEGAVLDAKRCLNGEDTALTKACIETVLSQSQVLAARLQLFKELEKGGIDGNIFEKWDIVFQSILSELHITMLVLEKISNCEEVAIRENIADSASFSRFVQGIVELLGVGNRILRTAAFGYHVGCEVIKKHREEWNRYESTFNTIVEVLGLTLFTNRRGGYELDSGQLTSFTRLYNLNENSYNAESRCALCLYPLENEIVCNFLGRQFIAPAINFWINRISPSI